MFKRNSRKYVETFYPYGASKDELNFEGIRKYYDNYSAEKYGSIDNQSFSDLNMDLLFKKIDTTYSSAGEEMLYNMLRTPVRDKDILNKRSDIIDHFKNNEEDRIKVQEIMYNLAQDKKFSFIDFLNKEYKGNKFKRWAYFIIGRVIPIITLLLVFIDLKFLWILFALFFVTSSIGLKERAETSNKPFTAIYYSSKIIKAAKEIKKLNIGVLKTYEAKIDKSLNIIGSDAKKINSVSISIMGGVTSDFLEPFIDLLGCIVLNVENAYYSMIDNLSLHKNELRELYKVVGEIDALVAIHCYKERSEYKCTKPVFLEKGNGFKIIEGAHPIIENVVKNSIEIDKKGIVLTGTNMSGKSTFLRMIGTNIVLAQSFNFVHADKYESEFLNFVSSISPDDDINEGKSYYLAEAQSILRILNALEGEYKVFCAIDEIFRGTNPIERIAASEEILRYIQKRNSVSIVATHDRELTELLDKTHDFYHFSEKVSDDKGLSFDYKLKKGILKTRNAIKLLKYLGYPDEITDAAFESIKEM